MMENINRACSVYCEGDILHYVQLSGIYNDSKVFVDMPMKADPEEITAAFATINPLDTDELMEFLDTYFFPSGSDVVPWTPTDLTSNPSFIDAIPNENYRAWAYDLNQLWTTLGRQANATTMENPQRSSLLPRAYPMVVPGGRFHESYYWDSWWIIRGLLVCDMPQTAKNVIMNLLSDVENFGFIPNGGRIYFLDRSQPPLLSEMIRSYVEYYHWTDEEALSFLAYAYPLLEKEYQFWMNFDNQHITTIDTHQLNLYHSNGTTPRPESYKEDYMNGNGSVAYYRNIRTGAETGWDFSSRWIGGDSHMDLKKIDANNIIPVELNAYMYRFERNMARFSELLNENDLLPAGSSSADYYLSQADERQTAIQSVLWDASSSIWRDYNITSASFSDISTASSYIPLWAGLIDVSDVPLQQQILDAFKSSDLVQIAGVLTTTLKTGEQWDAPNAWPPVVLLTIEGLQAMSIPESRDLAKNISTAWLQTCYEAYEANGFMYEKYNAFEMGVGGGGGEYVPQIGFGWSNGVALVLLNATTLAATKKNNDTDDSEDTDLIIGLTVGLFAAAVLVVLGVIFYNKQKHGSFKGNCSKTPDNLQLL